MPGVGLKHIVAAKYNEGNGVPTYTEGKVIAELMKVDIKWDKGDAKVFSDDALSDVDTSVTGGKETLEVNDITLENQGYLLGHSYSSTDGLIESSEDVAPYVGHGFYGKRKLKGVVSYRAVWIYKSQYSQPDESHETKGEKPKFTTPKIEGEIMEASNSRFRVIKDFDTESEAKAWLDGLAGVTGQCVTPVASLKAGTYTGTKSVTLTAGTGETIYYTTDGLTPTTSSTEYTGAISVSESTMIRAISTKSGSKNSAVASYEYTIN